MNTSIKFIFTILSLFFVFNFLNANDEIISKTDVDEQNKMSDAKTVKISDATDDIEDWKEEVLNSFGIDSYGENNGKFIIFAKQSLSLKPTDPQFGDALINAFDKAMLTLQEKYIMIRFGKTTTEKVKSFFSDRSTNAKEIEVPQQNANFYNKILMIMDKNLDLASKKIDSELVELGVDPEQLKTMPQTVKKEIFKDKFIKKTIRKASGSIAGLVPLQTKLIVDKSGKAVIGIVAIASQKTLQIAKDISLQRATNISGKGREIKTLLPSNKKDYLSTMGIRLAYDTDGSPVIISYGLGSYIPDAGDDYINDELRAEAKESAVANADAQIAEMINGRMNAKSERLRGEETKNFVEKEQIANSDTVEKTVKNMIKISNKYAKSSASAKLQGISTVKTWRYTFPNSKIKMVGAVRVWKYSTLNAVKDFNNTKTEKKKISKKSNDSSYNNYESKSKVVNTMEDF